MARRLKSGTLKNRITGLKKVKASAIVGMDSNWRLHGDAQRAAVKASLDELGQIAPLLVRKLPNGKYETFDGHLRTDLIRSDIGPNTLVTVAIVDLTEAEAKKANLILDPLAAMAQTNTAKLTALMEAVGETGPELAKMLADLKASAPLVVMGGATDPDEVPEPPKKPVAKRGDLWLLGNHRLLCGDSTKAEDVKRLMGGKRVGLCFTSPPYGQQRDYGETAKELVKDWFGLMKGVFAHLPMSANGQVLVNLGLIHRDNEWVPYWEPWIAWMAEQGWKRFGWYVWDQGSGLPGDWNGRFAPSHEWVFHFNKKAIRPGKFIAKKADSIECRKDALAMRKKDGTVGKRSSPAASLQPTKVPDSVIRITRDMANGIARQNHPAIFPVAFPSFIIQSWMNDVYEPFAGSGSTLIATHQHNRRCYGIEIEPKYCDVIIERWQNFTGQKAKRAK